MNIRDAHIALSAVLETLEITEPSESAIRKVYRYFPPANQMLGDVPCALSTFELTSVNYGSAMLQQRYNVNLQLVIGKAIVDANEVADAAASFNDALIRALSQNLLLDNTVAVVNTITGTTPDTLKLLEWGGEAYIGLEYDLEITLSESWENAA